MEVKHLTREQAKTEALELLGFIKKDLAAKKIVAPRAFRFAALVGEHNLLETEPVTEAKVEKGTPVRVFEILRELIDLGDIEAMKVVVKRIRNLELKETELTAEERLHKAYHIAYMAYYDTY